MKNKSLVATLVATASLAYSTVAWPHTISIGYENVGVNAINFWYGTYHSGVNYNEGSFHLVNPTANVDITTAFSLLVSVKPSGLIDGDTNFYAAMTSTTKQPTNVDGRTVLYWQGVSFTNLAPGTYTFTYIPIANPTQEWEPISNAILSSTVTLIRADLAGPTAPRLTTTQDQTGTAATAPTLIMDGGTLQPTTTTTVTAPTSITRNGGTIDTQNGDVTLQGDIDGRGTLNKINNGTLTITGTNTNTGGLNVTGGTVSVGSDSNLGSTTAPVTLNGGTLQFSADATTNAARPITLGTNGGTIDTQANNDTIAGTIGGSGGLNKVGSGTLTLNGPNTYTGGTTVGAGTLIGNTTSIRGDVANSGNLVFNQTADGTYGNVISGSGSLGKTGAGTLTLSGPNTFTGGTTISGGAIALGNVGALGSGDIVLDNGALLSSVSGTVLNTVRSVSGTNNTIAAAPNQNLTLGGPFDGGTGTVTTFGTNGNTGTVTFAPSTVTADPTNQLVVGGGTLVAGNGQLGQITASAQSTTIGAAGTLDLGGFDTTIRNLQGTGALNTGSASALTLGGGSFGGTISGGAGLTLLGNGTGSNSTVLSGTNTYSGDTVINSGSSLTVQGGSAIPATSAVTNNGSFLVANSQSVGSLAGTGNTSVATGAVLNAGGNNRDTTYAGAISGDGGLTKSGMGTMVLSGNNTYTGATTVGAGTLQVDGALASGVAVQNGATLTGAGQIGGAVTIADGGVLAPAGSSLGTLTVGSLALSSGSILNYGLGQAGAVGGGANDLVQVNGNLTLGGTLNIANTGGFGEGVYRLMNYTGSLTNNGLAFGSLPSTVTPNGLTVQTAIGGQVNLVVAGTTNLHFWDGAQNNADNSVAGGSRIWSNAPTNWTNANGSVNTAWGGGFAVFQATPGTVTVDGAIQTTGMQFMSDGYRIANTNGSSLVNNTAQTSIRVDPGASAEIAAPITGSAALVKRDAGTLILSGTNAYTGGTAITGGKLVVSQDANLGQASGALQIDSGTLQATNSFTTARAVTLGAGNGTITVDGGQNLTLTGAVGGTGALTKADAGTLTLSGTNTFSGPTTVSGGTLALTAGASLASAVQNNATFVNAGTVSGGLTNAGTLVNTGVIAGGFTNTGTANLGSGAVNGAVVNTAGTLTAGGTVTTDGTLGNAAGAMLSVADNANYTVGGLVTNGGTVTVGAGGTLTAPTGISNSGALVIAQGGKIVDALDNSGSVDNAGTYVADVTNAASGTITNRATGSWFGNLLANVGRVLNLGAWSGDANNGAGGDLTNGGTFTTASAPLNNAGTFTNSAGATLNGGLATSGTATNAGTINGPVTVSGGALTTSGTINGNLTNAGTVTASGALNGAVGNATGASFVVAGPLTGIGAFTNNGVLDLGANALAIGSLAGTDATALVRNGALTTGLDNTSTRYAGTIANGAGVTSLTKTGTGTLTLSGTNTYTGGTVLSGGRLAVASDGNLGAASGGLTFSGGALQTTATLASSRAVTLAQAGGTLVTDAGTTLTLSGPVSGAGSLTKAGTGTLNLKGTNTYAGGTVIGGGAVVGSATSFGTGAITNNGTLILDQGTSATLANAIGGSGMMGKTGAGSLNYTGTGTFSGGTLVSAGRMAVNGSLANSVFTVADGAVLGGNGTVGGIVTQSGGIVGPGNSIGQLNVAGNVAFVPGSVYQVEANAGGQSDRIVASGSATLTGGTVQVLATPGAYQPRTRYTILTAAAGVGGRFAGSTTDLAFLTPFLSYDATNAYLTLARNDLQFAAVAQTRNQASVASAAQATAVGSRLYDAIAVLSAPQARQAYDALSGEIHSSTVTAEFATAYLVREAILDRLRFGTGEGTSCAGSIGQDPRSQLGLGASNLGQACASVPTHYTADLPGRAPRLGTVPAQIREPSTVAVWGQGFGAFGSVSGNGNAARLDQQNSGFVLGADARVAGDWRLGLAGGYTFTSLDATGRASTATVESGYGAVYGSGNFGALQLRLGGAFGGSSLGTQRAIAFAGFSDTASSRYSGTVAQGFGEVGYRIGTEASYVEPFVGGAVIRIGHDGFRENGGTAALIGAARDYDLATSTVGVQARTRLDGLFDAGAPIFARGLLGYRRAFGDVVPSTLLSLGAGGQQFVTAGIPVDRDALVVQAGLDWQVAPTTTLSVAYTGQAGSRAQDHGVKGSFLVRW